MNIDYVKKTTVVVDTGGSTLTLAPVQHNDAGYYYEINSTNGICHPTTKMSSSNISLLSFNSILHNL